MIVLREQAIAGLSNAADERALLWGLKPIELHDRVWASRGIQVIRPNSGEIASSGPGLYLLLDGHQLCSFNCKPVLKLFHWRNSKAVRLRIRSGDPIEYREVVRCDSQGRFQGIHRDYERLFERVGRCWMTSDRRVATRWACAKTHESAVRELRSDVPACDRSRIAVDGQLADCLDDESVATWLESTIRTWDRVSQAIDGVYQLQPGVWAHETSIVEEGVRFAGPAWIGAGVTVQKATVVVGPLAIYDDVLKPLEQTEVTWNYIVSPLWRMSPRLRRGKIRSVTKRAFDIIFSILVLILFLPAFPIVVAAIYLEDGWPVFFGHRRQSLGGKSFSCYKFRTMCRDAEALKAELIAANVCDGPQFFLQDDPRLLKSGKILRRLQIDEMPQFWNVLRGEMSIVGPRPSPDKENQYCPAWREARLSVRPGVTGLWQIRRTREVQTDFQEWIRYDLQYVQYESWRMDIWIILQTVKKIISG